MTLVGCERRSGVLSGTADDTTNSAIDTVGTLISKIDFKLKANREEAKIFTDGIVPWISLDTPQVQINRLADARKIVLAYSAATLIIDYPLRHKAVFRLSGAAAGFSREQLIEMISEKYHQIYTEEERTATVKTLPASERKMMNRNETNGKYGIWGHDLSDLDLDDIEVYKQSNGKIYLLLEIDS